MEYVQTHSTKKPLYLLAGISFATLGGLLSPIMLYGVIAEQEYQFIVPTIITVALFGFGILFIYWYFSPKTGRGIITEHSIRCEMDGKIKHEIAKTDIDHVIVPLSYRYSIKIIMDKGKGFQKSINCFYFQDLDGLHDELLKMGYQVRRII